MVKRLVLLLALSGVGWAQASEPVTDCVIDNHQAVWQLSVDGSADVVENLDVNCGDLSGKHGIFRIIPRRVPVGSRPDGYRRETPITNVRVTDASGNPYNYEIQNEGDTLKLKIGSASVLISGRLHYQISYSLGNVVWPDPNTGLNHVDINVVGQFWQLPIDRADVSVVFPGDISGVTPKVVRGGFGTDFASDSTTVSQPDANSWRFVDETTFEPDTGLTVSLLAPAEMFTVTSHQYSDWEQWGGLLWLLWPILILGGAWRVWRQWGKDVKLTKAHMVQYTPPADLAAYEAYLLQHNGASGPTALSGLIIGLAVKGYLQLERKKSGLLGKQVIFTCLKEPDGQLSEAEKAVMAGLFGTPQVGESISSKKLSTGFQSAVRRAEKAGLDRLKERQWFESSAGRQWPWLLLGVIGIPLSFTLLSAGGLLAFIGPVLAIPTFIGVIVLMVLMPRRTEAGAEVEWQLRGFQDYLKTAEQYRLQFSEKENLFEKYLPYAVTFGVTKEWARAMRNLYGEEYWANYHPVWYVGPFDVADIDSFTTAINSVASDVSSAMSSGTSGGSSGGGSGGGGGGSW